MRHAFASEFHSGDTASTSLSEILGAFSYALDLTEGQPAGHSLRSCWIASQIALALADNASSFNFHFPNTFPKTLVALLLLFIFGICK